MEAGPRFWCGTDGKAIAYGLFVTLVLSCTMVVAGLKSGITPGVSPLVVLCGWGAFRQASRGLGGSRFLNLSQVAGSGGMAVVSGVIFSEPMLQITHLSAAQDSLNELGLRVSLKDVPWSEAKRVMHEHGLSVPDVDVPVNILACLVGSLIGWGFVGLATRKFLSDPTLPAPEARACVSMINAAVSDGHQRPRLCISLVSSIVGSLAARILALIKLASGSVAVWSKGSFKLTLPFDSAALYLGIGALLTVPTALLTFSGSLLRLVGDYLMTGVDPGSSLSNDLPPDSMRWVGGGAMTVGVAYSLAKFFCAGLFRPPRRATAEEGDSENDDLLEIGKRGSCMLVASVVGGALVLAIWLFATEGFSAFSVLMVLAILVMAMLMVPLGAMLSLQIGVSCSPYSGTILVTTLVLSAVALATGHRTMDAVPTITTLLVATFVAVCSANDVSQDYKTLQLCGVAPREGFLAQILGLLVGAVVVPPSLYISHNAFGLGTSELPAPQGQMFATIVQGLLIEEQLPWYPIAIGLGIGVLAVAVEFAGDRVGQQLPAMALTVGVYLPVETGVGILIGAAFRAAGELLRLRRAGPPRVQTHECILAAAGMITGGAFLDLLLGVASLFSFTPEALALFSSEAEAHKVGVPLALCDSISVLGLICLGWILLHNSLHGNGDDEGPCQKTAQASCDMNASSSPSSSCARRMEAI